MKIYLLFWKKELWRYLRNNTTNLSGLVKIIQFPIYKWINNQSEGQIFALARLPDHP